MDNHTPNTENEMEDQEILKNDHSSENQEDQLNDAMETQEESDENEKLKQEKAELQDKYIRLYSEFENFRRRTAKEMVEMRLQANKDLIIELLPVMDDFERGLQSIRNAANMESLQEGVELIYLKFKLLLEKKGVKAIESKETPFDVEYHEALTKIPSPSADMKGKVIDEIEKGYTLHEKVIRYAKVVVAE